MTEQMKHHVKITDNITGEVLLDEDCDTVLATVDVGDVVKKCRFVTGTNEDVYCCVVSDIQMLETIGQELPDVKKSVVSYFATRRSAEAEADVEAEEDTDASDAPA